MAIEDLLHPLMPKYFAAPAWVKTCVGRAYRALPDPVRHGAAYRAFRDELMAVGDDPAAAARVARTKLSRTLQWAIESVPAYRRFQSACNRTADPVELLRKLPIVDRADIHRNPGLYVSRALPEAQRLRCLDISGDPLDVCVQKHVTRAKEQIYVHAFRQRAGVGACRLTLAMLGRPVPDECGWSHEPIRRQLLVGLQALSPENVPKLAEALERHRPACIEARPSLLLPLAHWLQSHPLPSFIGALKGVLLYGECVSPARMALFRRVFGCPVLRHFGHPERVLMAASLPGDERFFFWPLYGHLELVDAQERPILRPGVPGFIVGTSFDNQAMPFVRYRTGDIGVLGGTEHPELPGYPVCERIGEMSESAAADADSRASVSDAAPREMA